ncbi:MULTISPECIES: CehA/McbA family metallohydrolase [Dyella]|uniref:PHP domain-containing protein n=2 Tax=Dyella TaxID=231454 RepID=A0A4V2NKU0_9GAMM|nr:MULTISPECIES: CehA/McbA family metallohydrolase [Dyella]TBR36079.1 PHP domain-containing protein [Dyella terrae]TCI06128.1 PHP domain-containing protein [Dyella soli]
MTLRTNRIIQVLALLVLALGAFGTLRAQTDAPALVLKGQLTGKDNQTYRTEAFTVPDGTTRITVQFEYTGRDEKTTIDLGLLGPDGFRGQDGFRGWSGGSKALFTISSTDATPGYLPGMIRAGEWKLLLGIPNIRPDSKAEYTARVWFGHRDDPAWTPAVLNPPIKNEAGWYRGDLHMHTAHSDGSCPTQAGLRAPCPLFLTAQAAADRGLDFIAITDHNTVAHANAMRELQPYFDKLLLIPGREVTTFSGHANLFGTTAPVDFRVGSTEVPDWNTLLRNIAPLQGVISINHPVRPSGEICMGCGWTPKPDVDMSLVQAIEVVNGDDPGTPLSGIPFWEKQLNRGYRITAIGGSDNHDAFQKVRKPGSNPTGIPATVVHAETLSMHDIVEGIRAGHVFIDTDGTKDRVLEFTARTDSAQALMGDALAVPRGVTAELSLRATHAEGGCWLLIVDGKPLAAPAPLTQDDETHNVRWTSDGKRHWIRAEVRSADGRPLLIGNPVYVNP